MLEVNSNNGSHVQGFMQIELYNKESGISRIKRYNTVTNIGKQFMLAKSASPMLMGFGGSAYGRIEAIDTLGGPSSSGDTRDTYRYALQDMGLNNYLVNIPDTLTVDSKYLNIFDDNLDVDPTKLVGFANNSVSSADSKEGVQDFCKGVHMINSGAVANRWKYAEGVATGTFNYIAMAPGMHGRLKANGFYSKKCISRVNRLDLNSGLNSNFIMPGAIGLTGVNDVILNYTSGGVSRWRYNLVTGETVAVENTEPAFNALMYKSFSQVYIDGYLYVLDDKGAIRKINTTTGVFEKSLSSAASYVDCGASMYYDGTNIVVCGSYDSSEGTQDTRAVVKIINKDTLGVISSTNKVSWEGLGGVPFGWSRNRLLVKKAGAYYYVNYGFKTIKCTDLSNIKGTTVGMYMSSPYVNYINNGTDTWMIECGANYPNYNYLNASGGLTDIMINRSDTVYNSSDVANVRDYSSYGVWVSKEDCGNLISFVKLEPAIVKIPTDIMYVSYGYEFV